jgi:hypothetical protein
VIEAHLRALESTELRSHRWLSSACAGDGQILSTVAGRIVLLTIDDVCDEDRPPSLSVSVSNGPGRFRRDIVDVSGLLTGWTLLCRSLQ